MQISNKFTLDLKDFEKCKILVDVDCPVGTIYDYICAVKSFVAQKIAEVESTEKQKEAAEAEKSDDKQNESTDAEKSEV